MPVEETRKLRFGGFVTDMVRWFAAAPEKSEMFGLRCDFQSAVRYFTGNAPAGVRRNRIFSPRGQTMIARTLQFMLLFVLACQCLPAQTLKVVTMNIWTGLDYVGNRRIGEYEPDSVREQRSRILIKGLRQLEPDIIALQEVNPVTSLGSAIAGALGYDCIYERANAGCKIGVIGFPTNLNEGLVILAKKSLHLEFVDVWSLADGFGLFGNVLSLHWTERRLALVGKIRIGMAEIYLANVHLSSVVPDDSSSRYVARQIASVRTQDESQCNVMVEEFFEDAGNRMRSAELMLNQLNGPYSGKPFIILGDFNAISSQPELCLLRERGALLDAAVLAGIGEAPTWDPENNTNVCFSVQPTDARGDSVSAYGMLTSWYDGRPRAIDHIFLNWFWKQNDVKDARVIFDTTEKGLFASDHYGLLSTIDAGTIVADVKENPDEVPTTTKAEFEGLPILMYDTDTGFGYGVKGFFLNYLGAYESFDLLAFNSTGGEGWYRAVISVPDFELRQGKIYPLSFDFSLDYDRMPTTKFFGVGQCSSSNDKELYVKEPLEILGVLTRGFSREFVAQVGLKYRSVNNYGFGESGLFSRSLPLINVGRSSALTLSCGLRYDSRDSYVNPSRGHVVEITAETGGSWLIGDYTLRSLSYTLQAYNVLFYPKTVFAMRLWGQSSGGINLPIHVLPSAGGNRTLRGYPQDRFLDNSAMGVNAEVRFPIYWRFGGIVGADAARVFPSASKLTFDNWACNPVVGVRLYMDTFVVRADVGVSKESTGFYLNFGHLF
jgi:endonuclease/exonuclease/phosphatase family metal-dependent hydrolase